MSPPLSPPLSSSPLSSLPLPLPLLPLFPLPPPLPLPLQLSLLLPSLLLPPPLLRCRIPLESSLSQRFKPNYFEYLLPHNLFDLRIQIRFFYNFEYLSGLMSLGLVDLEILQRSGSPTDKKQADFAYVCVCNVCIGYTSCGSETTPASGDSASV